MHALLGVFILYRMTQRPALPADEQGSYVAMSSKATMVAAEMYGEWATEEESQSADDETPDEAAEDGNSRSVTSPAPAAPQVD